jgi:hypothetical protein
MALMIFIHSTGLPSSGFSNQHCTNFATDSARNYLIAGWEWLE